MSLDLNETPPPHCDMSVLHAPSECRYCDAYPSWQGLRELWGIAFTGYQPDEDQLPCPSDFRRGRGGAHAWAANRPTEVDPGRPGPHPRPGFGPSGDEPQMTFPGPARSRIPRWLRWRPAAKRPEDGGGRGDAAR